MFGLDGSGQPTGLDTAGILEYDPADITNKLLSYTGKHFADFRVGAVEKGGMSLACLMVLGTSTPLVFVKPGTYLESEGKQKTAFSVGTVYFRHGAKSEPGTSDDLALFLDREIAAVREICLVRLRQVVKVPSDAMVAFVPSKGVRLDETSGITIRLTTDLAAPAYRLADPNLTHPNRQKEVLRKVNGAFTVTSTIFYASGVFIPAHRYHGNYSSPTYSQTFIDWLIEQFRVAPDFFDQCKQEQRQLALSTTRMTKD